MSACVRIAEIFWHFVCHIDDVLAALKHKNLYFRMFSVWHALCSIYAKEFNNQLRN